MSEPTRIYLDHAATSWPKPEVVNQVVERHMRLNGAPAGRGAYAEAAEVERGIAEARRRVAEVIGASDSKQIVFTCNGTDSLNLALHGLLCPGDHVVTSVVEHNSVLRPLRFLEQHRGVAVDRVGCDERGFVTPDAIRAALRPNTRLVALVHASNVTGAIQPVAEAAQIAREGNAFFLVDAAQTLGQLPFSLSDIPADLVAAPGHKSLLGPLGTGVLYIADRISPQLLPTRQGGTGTHSEDDVQPETLPEKYESGNHNVPGILGLGAGIADLLSQGIAAIRTHHLERTEQLLAGLREIPSVKILGPNDARQQVGVVSVQFDKYDPQEVAAILDASHRIQVRAGFHCAAQMHRALGTNSLGGTVRFSVGITTTPEEIQTALEAVAEIAAAAV